MRINRADIQRRTEILNRVERQEVLASINMLLDKYQELHDQQKVMISVMKQFQDNLGWTIKLAKECSEELDGMRDYLTNSLKEMRTHSTQKINRYIKYIS